MNDARVEFVVVDPADADARYCVREYFAELDRRFSTGFDPAQSIPADDDELRPPHGLFLIARCEGEAIGCGVLKFHGDEPTELKRMWVSPAARGIGLGRRLLLELEQRAGAGRSRVVHLETNHSFTEAIAMYRAHGYVEVAPFNDEAYADHWFEKQLPEPPRVDR
jgi:GNAT superfamily N-acetyltransferase